MLVPRQEGLEVETCLSYKCTPCPNTVYGEGCTSGIGMSSMSIVLGKTVPVMAHACKPGDFHDKSLLNYNLKCTDHKLKGHP